MIKSIIIARSSMDRHEVSCESQIHEIREEAIRRGEIIVNELSFSKTTHTEFREDPNYHKLLAEIRSKNRKWTKIWFYDTSRVSRDRYYATAFKRLLEKHGVAIGYLKVPETGVEALDNLNVGILEAFDQLHSDFSRAGAIRGQSHNIRSGYRAGGRAPYGYQLKKHVISVNKDNEPIYKTTLERNPDTFNFAKEYFQRLASGESRRAVLRDFMARGIKSPTGEKTWHSSTGKSMEENIEVYQGHTVFNRHNSRIRKKGYKGGKKWKDREAWIIQENTHERCIDDDTAKKIKMKLEKNKSKRTNPGPKKYLLTDILYCGDCGTRMVGNTGYYSCQNKNRNKNSCSNSNIKTDGFDKEILTYLKDRLITKDFYQKYIITIQKQYEKYKTECLSDHKKYHKRIKELDRQISKLFELYLDDQIKPKEIGNRVAPLQQEKEELEAKVTDLSSIDEILDVKIVEFSSESIKDQLDRFEEMLNDDNHVEMRNFVREFINKITLDPKDKPKSKKWKRQVQIDSHVPALTMIKLASPRGFEPLLPA